MGRTKGSKNKKPATKKIQNIKPEETVTVQVTCELTTDPLKPVQKEPISVHLTQEDHDQIDQFVRAEINPSLRPWVFTNTYQTIAMHLTAYRKKQIYKNEKLISAKDFLVIWQSMQEKL